MNLVKCFDYDMPHALDRIGQHDAFERVVEFLESEKQYLILSMPTGVGKTGIIAELTQYMRVLALVRTKVLQESVYAEGYNFKLIKGKLNYPCAYAPNTHRADICGIPKEFDARERYETCEGSGKCAYFAAFEELRASARASTTYSKYISDRNPYNFPNVFAFDEAHDIPELVIEQSGFDVNVAKHMFLGGFGGYEYDLDMDTEEALQFMRRIYSVALTNKPVLGKLQSEATEAEILKHQRRLARHKMFLQKIETTALHIKKDSEELNIWHASITKNGDFTVKPMTASHHFKKVLNTGSMKTILMSATISPMVGELLGLEDNEFEYYEAPQQYPIEWRPIWDLEQPGMGRKQTEKKPALWNTQALRISSVLKSRPDVSSVILTSSKEKAHNLAIKLNRFGHDTFIPPTNVGTDDQLRAWENYRKPGATCISWSFWEGVSLNLDHMLFIANMRYPFLGSPFELARFKRNPTEFNYRAAVWAVQGAGRIHRGFLSDYRPYRTKEVFLADGNYKQIAPFAPGDFKERIQPYPGPLIT